MITYESQFTLQSQMASTRLTTILYGLSGAWCSRMCSSGSSGDKPSLQEEFMDFCTSPLTPKVMAITEVYKYRQAISQIKDCLETEYRYSTWQNSQKPFYLYPMGMLIPNIYSAILV